MTTREMFLFVIRKSPFFLVYQGEDGR